MKVKGAFVTGGILALDPGPTSSGWCLLVTASGRPVVVATGEVPSTSSALAVLVEAAAPSRMAVEVVRGYLRGTFAAASLFETAHVAGRIEQLAVGRGLACSCLTASEWRKSLLGKGASSDGAIKAWLDAYGFLPPWSTSAHVRDALGLGLAAVLLGGGDLQVAA